MGTGPENVWSYRFPFGGKVHLEKVLIMDSHVAYVTAFAPTPTSELELYTEKKNIYIKKR